MPATSPRTSYPIPPTAADVPYGPHERQVLDYWAPPSPGAPLVIYVHGGGFMMGDKTNIQLGLLESSWRAGLALASINYRLSDQVHAPAFMRDGARALQFLRAQAPELGFDPRRVAMCGSSAGAGISLWVGFHKDLADPASDDPVARQSTRVNCIAIRDGQCSYDPRLFRQLGLKAAVDHAFIEPFYGISRSAFDTPQAHSAFDEAAAVTHIRPGAPPVYACYTGSLDPVPSEEPRTAQAERAVHHPRLGLHLKQRLEAVGTACTVETGVTDGPQVYQRVMKFLMKHLT